MRVKSEFGAYNDTDAVTVFTPMLAGTVENPVTGWSASGSYLVDVVSAASVDIVSTASGRWQETRHAASLGGGYKPGKVGGTLASSVSREPDYLSLSASGTLTVDMADKTVNPTLGYAYTHDTAGRTGTPFSVFSRELERHTATASVELVLGPSSILQLGVDAMLERGDQTKPYRLLPLFAADVAPRVPTGASIDTVNRTRLPGRATESTPLSRNRGSFNVRFARRFSGSTLAATERIYGDDWGLLASTTDLRFSVDLSRRVFLWAHLRGHVQNGVSFWRRAYVATLLGQAPIILPRYRTGDRELSALQAATVGLGLHWDFGAETSPWGVTAQADFLTTSFSDTLFITSRRGALGVLQLETSF